MRIFVYTFAIAFIFLLLSCGTIKETTTTEIIPVKVPPTIIHDTIPKYIAWQQEGYSFVNLDSLKEWTLINMCKGEETIDTAGIKLSVSYSYKHAIKTLADSLSKLNKVVSTMKVDLNEKEKIIQGTKITTEKESTPGQLWIWTHSFLYQFLAAVFAVIVLIILQMKLKFL